MRTMAAASVGEHDRALNSMNVSMFATMFAQSSRVHIARDMPGWITLARMRKLRVGGGGGLVGRTRCARSRQAGHARARGRARRRGQEASAGERHPTNPTDTLASLANTSCDGS